MDLRRENRIPSPEQTSLLEDEDLYLFNEGTHTHLYRKLGAHPLERNGRLGTYFAVWAPSAKSVSVIGDFNSWNPDRDLLHPRGQSGIWEGFIDNAEVGAHYKFHIISRNQNYTVDKADPFAFFSETPPKTASVIWNLDYAWKDQEWMEKRRAMNSLEKPISIYEMHLGSWIRPPERQGRFLNYRELASRLIPYLKDLRFTHVEFLPVMEHPFYGSWGYQTTGYFAPSSRYGTPQDLMFLIDALHQAGIGVILDWVPSHFPNDEHGLGYFDGTHLYEHADPRQGFHPDWKSCVFNYGRHEVRSFLISSAYFWLDYYHADGLRVDAVASMLYLDYSRKAGEWIPNSQGGRENLEAVEFLKHLNAKVYWRFPDVQMIAEESTAWPMVSRPVDAGGLGFGFKWDMGWMHDALEYFQKDPLYRKHHHNLLTFRSLYAYTENFILPLSHDEVVYGKGSLINKMRGDLWQKFAHLRLLYGYLHSTPGKKLLFMGAEFAQWREWNHEESLEWHLCDQPLHRGVQHWVKDLNAAYRREPALYALDCDPGGFQWISGDDAQQSILSFLRRGKQEHELVLIVLNFTPVPRLNYRVGVPHPGFWEEILNSDAAFYGGSSFGNLGGVSSTIVPYHGQAYSLNLTLPPLGALFLKWKADQKEGTA